MGPLQLDRRLLLRATVTGTTALAASTGETTATRNLRYITYGDTRTGTIEESDPLDPEEEAEGDEFHAEPVEFEGEEGDQIQVTMESQDFEPWLRVTAPDGDEVVESDEGGVSQTTVSATLEADGRHTIWTQTYRPYNYGEYSLELRRTDTHHEDNEETDSGGEREDRSGGGRDLREIEYGQTKRGELDRDDPSGHRGYYEPVTFDGDARDQISIQMESDADTYLYLRDPDDDILTRDDDGGGGYDSAIRDFELPESGEYTIVATSYDDDATFQYDLTLQKEGRRRSDEDDEGSTTDYSTTDAGDSRDLRTIEYGETKDGRIDEGDPHGYNGHYEPVSFTGTSGDVVTIEMTSSGDTLLVLQDPDGVTVTRNDDGGSNLDSRIEAYELTRSGEYTIIATSFDPSATFEYALSLSRVERADETDPEDDTDETTARSESRSNWSWDIDSDLPIDLYSVTTPLGFQEAVVRATESGVDIRESTSGRTLEVPGNAVGYLGWDRTGTHLVGNVEGNVTLWPDVGSSGREVTVTEQNTDLLPTFHESDILLTRENETYRVKNTDEFLESAASWAEAELERVADDTYRFLERADIFNAGNDLFDVRHELLDLLTVESGDWKLHLSAGQAEIEISEIPVDSAPQVAIEVELRDEDGTGYTTAFDLRCGYYRRNNVVCFYAYTIEETGLETTIPPTTGVCVSTDIGKRIDEWTRFVSQYLLNVRWQLQALRSIRIPAFVYTFLGYMGGAVATLATIGAAIGSVVLVPFTVS